MGFIIPLIQSQPRSIVMDRSDAYGKPVDFDSVVGDELDCTFAFDLV